MLGANVAPKWHFPLNFYREQFWFYCLRSLDFRRSFLSCGLTKVLEPHLMC